MFYEIGIQKLAIILQIKIKLQILFYYKNERDEGFNISHRV